MPVSPPPVVNERTLSRALQIAIGDLAGNIRPYQDGLLKAPSPCLFAGLDYDMPWTRDGAFNTWFALGLLAPDVARNTLLSLLVQDEAGEVRIGGQYWDAIIWSIGVWNYYLYTSDRTILSIAHHALSHSLTYFERTEFDPGDGLFRGGACFQDGIAAYPDYFAPGDIPYTGILDWIDKSGKRPYGVGVGLPCKALSTNCLYYRAYQIAGWLAEELECAPDPSWAKKAENLRAAIQDRFWRESLGRYGYLVDAPGNDDAQEGFGLAFALLFEIADDGQAQRIFDSVYVAPHGLPCLWPSYSRYGADGEFGRHSGPIWPHVNAVWALACQSRGRPDLAQAELNLLAEKACRDSEFAEVYHPITGVPYGGRQEALSGKIESYWVCHRQSWCASGFIAMFLYCHHGLPQPERRPLSRHQHQQLMALLPEMTFRFS